MREELPVTTLTMLVKKKVPVSASSWIGVKSHIFSSVSLTRQYCTQQHIISCVDAGFSIQGMGLLMFKGSSFTL